MAREIDEIKDAAGAYRRWALEARKKYIELRLKQDPEIRGLYIRAADRVARELRKLALKTPSSYLRKRQLEELETALRAEADRLTGSLTKAFEQYIEQAVDAGVGYSQAVALSLFKKAGIDTAGLRTMFATVNRQAVEACWARTKKGLFLSDRIWEQGEKFRNTMRDIIQEAVATGQDAVKTARMLQQYVRQGAMTLARDYPNMMKRMKGRIPGDISYEALRLARTEMTAAFGEGTIAAARGSPSYIGMKWVLSHSHPVVDICDTLAEHDEGLGRGVYSLGNEPPLPAHPNCYDEETEVYTNKGWMHFKDLQGDELILSINPDTKEIEWVPFIAKVVYQYKGKMIHFKNRSFDLMVTPDHRMYITARVGGQRRQTTYIEPARKTISRHEFRIPRVGVWQGEEPEQVTIGRLKIKTEVYCKLMGYFLSEGCAHQRKDNGRIQVTISQCGQNMHQIIRDLDGLPVTQWRGKNHLYLSDLDLGRYLLQFGKSDEKFVPDEIKRLSPRLIRIFLDAYRLGDGTERVIVRDKLKLRSIERQYFTSSKRMADDIGELILKVGNYPSFKVQKSKGKQFKHKNGTYTSNVDIWRVSENTTRAALYSRSSGHGLKVETVDYDGLVYDVQLAKNHVLWVRRNGKTCWSGNCICTLVPVHEEPEKFVERLKKWRDDPTSDQELEKWYNNVYKSPHERPYDFVGGIKRPAKIREYAEGYKIVAPADLDNSKQLLSLADVNKIFKRIPKALRQLVSEIQLLDYRNPADSYWEQVYNIPGYRSFATGGQGQIHFYENGYMSKQAILERLFHTLAHEAGHNLDQVLGRTIPGSHGRFSISSDWIEAIVKDGGGMVSQYAQKANSPVEDFADSVAFFVKDKREFAKLFPSRAKILKAVLRR